MKSFEENCEKFFHIFSIVITIVTLELSGLDGTLYKGWDGEEGERANSNQDCTEVEVLVNGGGDVGDGDGGGDVDGGGGGGGDGDDGFDGDDGDDDDSDDGSTSHWSLKSLNFTKNYPKLG